MPIHDWSRVNDGMFHWFHQVWVAKLSDYLNQGGLPNNHYAIGETYSESDHLGALDSPRFAWEAETDGYLARKDLLAIRNVEGILIAAIEIVSPGNKSSQARLQKFVKKTIDFLDQGVHVLVIDRFPPTPRDPCGIHQVIWKERFDGEFEFHPDKPATLASYMAASEDCVPRAYVDPIAMGEALPTMPLFLWPDRYINVELEGTYESAWAVYPAPLKPKLEKDQTTE